MHRAANTPMSYLQPIRTAARRYSTTTHPERSPARHHQTIKLSDGRTLGFAEFGDPTGKPLVYLHGYPSSRLESRDIEPMANKLGIRIIAPDRPGFGLSTLRPSPSSPSLNLQFTDYPADLLALTDHLALPRFSVLAGSGGGPYALACAHSLPPARLHGVGLLASAGPWRINPPVGGSDMAKELQKNIMWSSYLIYIACTYAPRATTALTDGLVGVADRIVKTPWVERKIDGWLEATIKESARKAGKADSGKGDEEVDIAAIRESTIEIFKESFAQGAEGAILDARRLTSPWGIPFSEVTFPVKVWHGAKDVNSPVGQIRYLVSQLPDVQYVEYPDFNHFQVGTKMEEILKEMVDGLPPK